MNTGQTSQEIVTAFFKRQGKAAFLHRVTDQAEVFGMNKGKPMARVKKQPSDNILTWKGTTHFLEVKSSKAEPSFPFGNIETQQRAAAIMVAAAGGSYVFALHRLSRDLWYWVEGKDLFRLADGKQSCRWDALTPYLWNPYA